MDDVPLSSIVHRQNVLRLIENHYIARATAQISTYRRGKIPLPAVVLHAVNGLHLWLKIEFGVPIPPQLDTRVRLPASGKQHRVHEYTGQRIAYAPGADKHQREGANGVCSPLMPKLLGRHYQTVCQPLIHMSRRLRIAL